MRTTLRLDDQLFSEAKRLAAESGRTLTSVVEDALREMLASRKRHSKRAPTSVPSHGQGGLRPGIDLDDSAALLDLMDRDEDAAT